ncbi:MAG TPA: class I SAM-dependent methyltransferase [Anaerolineales bacterium]|nr:class I SAM-dependent methyltransferase [Anaerolineales bacterium]
MKAEEAKRLNDEGRERWDQKAEFWDELHGEEGNRYHRELIAPAVKSLLDLKPGEQVLDIACGSGVLARQLAALGGVVTAVDFSEALLARAKARKQSSGELVRYQVVDATDEEALADLGEGVFDAVTCTMALMDMPVIAPLYRAVRRLLAPGGRFVFATSHPAFSSNNPVFAADLADVEGEEVLVSYLKIRDYLAVPPVLAVGASDEPTPHYYYHRPLQELLGTAFEAGLVLDGLLEPGFDPPEDPSARPLSWYAHPQIPPVLAGRMM